MTWSAWAIIGDSIRTMEHRRLPADTLIVEGERIRRIGRSEDLADDLRAAAEVIDARGRTILPGFIDTHAHMVSTGLTGFKLDLSVCTSLRGALDRIAAAATDGAAGQWLFADGLAAGLLTDERRLPTRTELDRVSTTRPVFVGERTGHASATNRLGWSALSLEQEGEAGETGVLEGRLNTAASGRADRLLAEQVGYQQVVEAACRQALAAGVTSVHCLDGSSPRDDPGVRTLVDRPGNAGPRLKVYTQSWDVEGVQAMSLSQIGGCESCGLDGAFTPRTARLLDPYADGGGQLGRLYFDDEDLLGHFRRAHAAGLQISVHCVGDGAVQQALDTYERVLTENPRADHRHRIEHAELITPDQMRRARRLGIAFAIQPAFNHFWRHDEFYPPVIGADRADRVDPIASLLRESLLVAGGSDSPVTPLRPLLGVHSAVLHSNPHERVDVEQALRLFTADAARIGRDDGGLGTLAEGKLADFVVLEADPTTVDPHEIKDIPVAMTVVAGRPVFSA